jgi:hypothetical protein
MAALSKPDAKRAILLIQLQMNICFTRKRVQEQSRSKERGASKKKETKIFFCLSRQRPIVSSQGVSLQEKKLKIPLSMQERGIFRKRRPLSRGEQPCQYYVDNIYFKTSLYRSLPIEGMKNQMFQGILL